MRDLVSKNRTAVAGAPALGIAVVSILVVGAVWTLQARGYNPCELCLKERIPFYVGIPLASVVGLGAARLPRSAIRAGYVVLGLVFAVGAVLGAYHAGVEWKFWPGPSECSGTAAAPVAVGDFLKQLQSVTVVRCDEAALQVMGLSLAAWNALLSAGLAAVGVLGWRRV